MKVSLFVTTYEMPRHLQLVCAGLERQTFTNFEVFFCDDGSGPETARVIQEFSRQAAFPSHHIWHEHQGFRKCRILNKALRVARGETLVFLDGDCIPHRDFIKDHVAQQEEGYYLAGRRVELGQKISSQLSIEEIRNGFFDRPNFSLLKSALTGDSEFLNRSVRIPWPKVRALFGMDRVVDMKGCNYSVSKKAIETINGFDEEYEGYGREDTDVEIRLQNLGLKIKSLKGIALQFHVWHPRREFTPANDERLEELKRSRKFQCKQGLVCLP